MTGIVHRNGDRGGGGWTLDTLQEHNQIVDALKDRLDAERDRRYSEVNIEREKALKIKEEADKAALGLAREIQSYKDEKANQLREQIGSERGTYATKDDLAAALREINISLVPLNAFVAGAGGRDKQATSSTAFFVAVIGIIYGVVASLGVVWTLILKH